MNDRDGAHSCLHCEVDPFVGQVSESSPHDVNDRDQAMSALSIPSRTRSVPTQLPFPALIGPTKHKPG